MIVRKYNIQDTRRSSGLIRLYFRLWPKIARNRQLPITPKSKNFQHPPTEITAQEGKRVLVSTIK
mgnify:CR=1 FL=1